MQTLVGKSILRSLSKVTDLGESQHVQLLQNSVPGKMHLLKTGSSPIFFPPISFMYWICKVLVQSQHWRLYLET